MSILKLVTVFLADEENRKAVSNVIGQGIKMLGGTEDQDGDGDFDQDDAIILLEQAKMLVSVWGHAAYADGKLEEEEEEAVINLFDNLVFVDILPHETLELLELSRKDVRNNLLELFEKPYSIKKVSKYAIETELEEIFYEHACVICGADNEISKDEREFLDIFADLLELNKFDKRKIERESFN